MRLDDYTVVRRLQAEIVRLPEFKDGDLLEASRNSAVEKYAGKLCARFFPETTKRGLAVQEDIVRLYTSFLVLSPIFHRTKRTFKVDWHRGHLLTRIRRLANSRVGRFWFGVVEMDRERNLDRLRANLHTLGIKDDSFYSETVRDQFRIHYGVDCLRGRLANAIFDGVVFNDQGDEESFRIGNRFLKMSRHQFEGAVDMRDEFATVWDYRIRYAKKEVGGKIDILVAEHRIDRFRGAIKQALRSKTSPGHRVVLLDGVIRDFVVDAKYAKSAHPQIVELAKWVKQKVRTLAGTVARARTLPNLLVDQYRHKCSDRFFVNKPNFFWAPNRIPEEVYINFFSPYREWH